MSGVYLKMGQCQIRLAFQEWKVLECSSNNDVIIYSVKRKHFIFLLKQHEISFERLTNTEVPEILAEMCANAYNAWSYLTNIQEMVFIFLTIFKENRQFKQYD